VKPQSPEAKLFSQGLLVIAGVDEAGRGACAGPLVAAAVAVSAGNPIFGLGIRDSKDLTESERKRLALEIRSHVQSFAIVEISNREIDEIGLQRANLTALRRALNQLELPIDYALIDGYPLPGLSMESLALYKADQLSEIVGAASILAKVRRDEIMGELDQLYPGYGFSSHKGYGTKSHMTALGKLGICEIHRISYKNVAAFIPAK
jgi:ribonuclease HII